MEGLPAASAVRGPWPRVEKASFLGAGPLLPRDFVCKLSIDSGKAVLCFGETHACCVVTGLPQAVGG